MDAKERVVLDLNRRIKVMNVSEWYKLSVKQIMKLFNVSKTQVYEILKRERKSWHGGKTELMGKKESERERERT
jgi:predicted DNA-binding protein YlxM (UPF0122 family)